MLLGRLQIEGDYNEVIQCPEVTSSTEKLNYSPILQITRSFPRGRPSYSSRTYLNLPLYQGTNRHPMRILNNLQNPSYNPLQVDHQVKPHSTRLSLICLGAIFFVSLSILVSIYSSFPELTPEERQHIKIPWNFDDAKKLGFVLNRYKDDHYYQVLMGVCITYVFLQAFAIPGSLFLSVLSGFLFTFIQALVLVCTCSALGASLCFLISQLVGRRLIFKYFPEKAAAWGVAVEKHKDNLLNYVIFLRVTPFLPNWFINLTAPVIGVPLIPFALGTFIGVAPPSFIALQAGKTLNNMSATDNPLSWTSVTLLIIFGVLSLVPIYFKDKLKKKFE